MIPAVCQHQIVADTALRRGEKPIALTVLRQIEDIDWHESFKGPRHCVIIAPPQHHLSHMADIEQASVGPGVKMLFEHP